MKSLKESSPFTSLNAKRINIIGILFLINWLFDIVFSLLLVPHVNNIKNEYFKITPIVDVDFTYVFVGFLIMALASIFKYGIKLEEEKKLTI